MADVSPLRNNIDEAEVKYRAAVSEATGFKIAGAINFINNRQYTEKQFFLNGPYAGVTPPFYFDGKVFFEYDAEIINVWMFVNETTTGTGTTEIDVEYSTDGTTWTSIFSTTPKIQNAAGSHKFISKNTSVANTTAPVISATNLNAGVALRAKLVQKPTASPDAGAGCGIVVHYRPR